MSIAFHREVHFAATRSRPIRSLGSDTILFPDDIIPRYADTVLALLFRDPDRMSNAHVRVYLACFRDEADGRQCFQALVHAANADAFPGLTYTNDDVQLDGRRMVYINSTCRLAHYHHEHLAAALARRFDMRPGSARIACACGAMECAVTDQAAGLSTPP